MWTVSGKTLTKMSPALPCAGVTRESAQSRGPGAQKLPEFFTPRIPASPGADEYVRPHAR